CLVACSSAACCAACADLQSPALWCHAAPTPAFAAAGAGSAVDSGCVGGRSQAAAAAPAGLLGEGQLLGAAFVPTAVSVHAPSLLVAQRVLDFKRPRFGV